MAETDLISHLMSQNCEHFLSCATIASFVTMSALVNTAGQYKVDANMLQAKDTSGKGKLTGFHGSIFFFHFSNFA